MFTWDGARDSNAADSHQGRVARLSILHRPPVPPTSVCVQGAWKVYLRPVSRSHHGEAGAAKKSSIAGDRTGVEGERGDMPKGSEARP